MTTKSITPATPQLVPPAIISHSTAVIRGDQHADITVHYAASTDARIAVVFSGVMMVFYSCQAVQGLLEAFAAARGHLTRIPREIPPPATGLDDFGVRTHLHIEWTRRPDYAATAQMALNKNRDRIVHWVDLYTGPITWQIRDQAGLLSMIELLTRLHRTATAVFLDGPQHAADPTSPDHRVA